MEVATNMYILQLCAGQIQAGVIDCVCEGPIPVMHILTGDECSALYVILVQPVILRRRNPRVLCFCSNIIDVGFP